MKHQRIVFVALLILLAIGMVGVLLILSASSAPAATDSFVPTPRLTASDVHIGNDATTIRIDDARWVIVAGTRSMEPVLVEGSQALERVPVVASEIHVGDIITYKSVSKKVTIIHRVIAIDSDAYGWYATAKGDNSPSADPERIRFDQVQGIVVAILY